MTGVTRGRLLLSAVVTVVVAAVVVGLSVGIWHIRHPRVFDDAGGWGFRGKAEVGQSFYVGMSYDAKGADGTAKLLEIVPDVVDNSSKARFEFYVCRVGGAKTIAAIGVVRRRDLATECRSLVPAVGAVVRLGRTPMDQIVMAVTPTRAGRVKVRGIRVKYTHGWKTGTQTIGGRITFRTRA